MIAIQEHLHISAVVEEKLKPCKVLRTKYFKLEITWNDFYLYTVYYQLTNYS